MSNNSGNKDEEGVMHDQWEKIKVQRTEIADRDMKMNKMHKMLSLQGQQLEAMEKRRRREEELLTMNMEIPQSNDDLKNAVGIFQMTLKERDDRIANLTTDLKRSFDENSRINNKVHDLSLKLDELGGNQAAQSKSEITDSSYVEISNNILCVII